MNFQIENLREITICRILLSEIVGTGWDVSFLVKLLILLF